MTPQSNNATTNATVINTQGNTTMTINTQLNAIGSSLASMNKQDKDLVADFLSGSTGLSTALQAGLTASFEVAKDKGRKEQANRASKALSLIVAHHMINTVGGKDTWLGDIIFIAAVRSSFWWKNKPKEAKEGVTYGSLIRTSLEKVVGNNEEVNERFNSALRFFKNYEISKEEDGTESLVYVTINKETKRREVEEIKEVPKSKIQVSLTPTGIRLYVKYKSVITPIKGQEFVFGRSAQQTYGTNVINEHLEDVLKSIRIHNEYEEYVDELTSDRTITKFRDYAYKFNREDALIMLLLLKENNIDIKELFKIKREGSNKILVLSRKEKNKGVKSLNRITVPAYTFSAKYGKSGVVSTNDAKMGFVTPLVTIPRMIEFTSHEGKDIVLLRESANKMASRFDKLNNAKPIWTRLQKVFIPFDATPYPLLNQALFAGNMLTPDSVLLSDGACRVVSDMDQGGIKTSYTPFKGIDEDLRKGDVCVIGVNGFKGGLLAAIGLNKGDTNYVPNLSRLIDANTLVGVEQIPESIVEQIQYESTTIINYLYNELKNNLTSMKIGNDIVEGVMVTVELKVTNPYTLDTLQFNEEEDDTVLEGAKAISETKDQIENVMEEMESGIRPSNGIRAYVAEQKAASADLFSVYEWMKEGLTNNTLKKKALTTKIISQEIQSIAHWEGKDVAKAFLNELLEEQKEHGFSVNKVYAYQLLGFYDRVSLNTIHYQDIISILSDSNKGIVEGSPVYFKETIKEILELISVHSDYGWLTVEFSNGSVEIPMGAIFVGDTLEQMEDEKSYVIAKGLLADLLEVIKTTVSEEGVPYLDSKHHLVMETFVQKPLLGKNFGYQFTKGYYGVALPLIGNYGITTIAITNRDRMEKSDDTWIPMTFSKSPQYFKGMTATYNVMDYNLGHALNLVMECAVFINPEMFVSVGNDFDGDLGRLSKGKTLPYVTLNYNEFNGNFFKGMYEDELNNNKFKVKKAQQCSLEEYHNAIYAAVTAKNNVGSYTANSYFYEAMTPNLIGKSFFGTKGTEVVVTEQLSYRLNAILKMLIQLEAMDNMKQEGASTFITEMLFNYKLRNLKDNYIESHLEAVVKNLMSLVVKVDIELDKEEVEEIVQLAYYTAITFSKESTVAFNIYGASNVNTKALANVMTHINTGEELNTMYNFKDSYEAILNGVDTESMYYEMILETGTALEACNFNVRA